jgi:hypothetical protein
LAGWRGLRWVLGVAGGLCVLLGVAVTASTQVAYGTVDWWGTPSRIHWCGRNYDASGRSVSRGEIPTAQLGDAAPTPLTTIGRLPPVVGRRLLASVTPVQQRGAVHPALPCSMGIYLEQGDDRFAEYSLSGGP